MNEINGILLVDKPKGITSQSLLTKIKKQLKIKKIGHAGTLDPLATGLMVVLLGSATKLSDYLLNNEKEYQCEILIGKSSDTEDITGKIIDSQEVTKIMDVETVLDSLIGTLKQVPPMYSSIHHNGIKLYELARQGIEVEREARTIEVKNIKLISDVIYKDRCAYFSYLTTVSKGTYIRTLCTEIGNRLGYPALMNELRRVKSGKFTINDAYTINDIIDNNYHVVSNYEAMKDKNIIEVDEMMYHNIMNGKMIKLDCEQAIVFLGYQNELLAIYEQVEKNIYKAKRVWN